MHIYLFVSLFSFNSLMKGARSQMYAKKVGIKDMANEMLKSEAAMLRGRRSYRR